MVGLEKEYSKGIFLCLGGKGKWRVEMVLFEMDGGDQREPMFGFQIIGMWGIWRVEICCKGMDG